MTSHHDTTTPLRRRRFAAWTYFAAGLVGCMVLGCQAPAVRPAAYDPEDAGLSRNVVLTRQLVTDTVVVAASHPLRGSCDLLMKLEADLRDAFAGAFYKRILLPFSPEPPPIQPNRPTLDPIALECALQKETGNELRPADVQLYVDGKEALAALHHVIDRAEHRIDVMMYLWDSDPLGEEVAKALAARAGPDRPVRVLVDGCGNMIDGLPDNATAGELNRVVCWLAHQPHVEVLRTRNAVARFDHRKLVVADAALAWSGGRNFTGPSFFENHDLSYTLEGPLASDMAALFDEFWQNQGGRPAPTPRAAPAPPQNNASARLVRTRPGIRQLAQALYTAVDCARHHVYVENPYITDPHLLTKLAEARQRGADVRVVLTAQGDSDIINHSNKVTANRLLRAGIRVYLYPGMTHVKATAVDGQWAYLGTGNFDYLSLRHNRELGVAVGEGPVIAGLEEVLFLPDFRAEWELTEPMPVTTVDYLFEFLASLVA